MATDLIADLTRVVADQPDITMTDAVCERMGALLADDAGALPDERVDPHSLAEATLSAAEASVVAALTDWQTAVGPTASAGTVLAPVDDPWLLADLLPVEMGFMRPGGENAAQLAEYHRSKRLAEAVKRVTPRPEVRSDPGLTAATAAAEFAAWLRARVPGQPEPSEDLDELIKELADSWNVSGVDAVYATCSPHRVALCVLHMRNYYFDDFADQLVALLPDWTRWLAARNATAPELADRCRPYAHGRPHPQLGDDDTKVDYLARIIE